MQGRGLDRGLHAQKRQARLEIIGIRRILECAGLQVEGLLGCAGGAFGVAQLLVGGGFFDPRQDFVEIETGFGFYSLVVLVDTGTFSRFRRRFRSLGFCRRRFLLERIGHLVDVPGHAQRDAQAQHQSDQDADEQ